MYLKSLNLISTIDELAAIPPGKKVINTINTYSFVTAKRDKSFDKALTDGDALLPDGIGVVWACRLLRTPNRPQRRISGWDLFEFEMDRLNKKGGRCFFMGSSQKTLDLIVQKGKAVYPNIEIHTYSPPYKDQFDRADNQAIIEAINKARPDLLWIGMSAPKQEKWIRDNVSLLDVDCHIGAIGAVFSFFAGIEKRAPESWQKAGFEWLYRFIHDPGRLWKRYILGNMKFAGLLVGEVFTVRK